MSDERAPYQVGEEVDSFHEESIRERVDAAYKGAADEGWFPQADVEYLLNIIDELRREPQAIVTEASEGYQRIGPDFDAWADRGLFAGRSLLLLDGSILTMHTCVLPPNFMWYVPLPSDPDDLKRCLLEIADHERIDLAPDLSLGAAARLILDKVKYQVRYMEPEAVKALERLAEAP